MSSSPGPGSFQAGPHQGGAPPIGIAASDVLPTPRFTPEELSALLGEKNTPTPEQSHIISSPLGPRLVIAGAGSGKTATMADRVVWLVANGWVRPEEILGVTFTRKAAGELASRIRAKLATLQRVAADDTKGSLPHVLESMSDGLEPKVSTYHSYASGIVSDYGLRLGIERDVVLLGAAQAWQLASEVVEAYDGEFEHFAAARSTLVRAVIQLAGECAEHLQDPASVKAWLEEHLSVFESLPYVAGTTKAPTQTALKLNVMLKTRVSVADMVARYANAKRARGALDFGDLVALAARIATEIPLAGELERRRFRVVLLDEFQDTSHAQLVLFSRLFGAGHAVTAVGDPNQSIYGFRGASAGQLFHFVQEFPDRVSTASAAAGTQAPRADAGGQWRPAPTSYLTTAWRNGSNILSAANQVAAPLNALSVTSSVAGGKTGKPLVPALVPSPAAVAGSVVIARFDSDQDEAQAIAADILRYRVTDFEAAADQPIPPAMAVLCRRRAQMEPIRKELETQGIPYEIVGLGGLLDTPEIVDLVATLRVLADPGRSDSLMRLLVGARWRIGPADLMAFRDWSAFLARRRLLQAQGQPTPEGATEIPVESDITDGASLVEALDWLPQEGWMSSHGRTLSEEAATRLRLMAQELRMLRGYLGDDLTTLLGEVERTMLLDIEVSARPGITIHQARRNLDAFQDAAAGFLQSAHRVDILAFLSWLDVAAAEESGLDGAATEVSHEAVQLLTVHASKGLEWDVVFVPGLNAGAFPSDRDSRWSSGSAALPWPLRGDRADLPQWDLDQPDQKGWLDAEKDFKAEVQAHGEEEERRLAYVAYTRAKHVLWASSPAWVGSRSGRSEISGFLAGLLPLTAPGSSTDGSGQAAAVVHSLSLEESALSEESPLTRETESAVWPYDPLEGPIDARTGERLRLAPGRRAGTEAAAGQILGALALRTDLPAPSGLTGKSARWAEETALLLERRSERGHHRDIHLPDHISASTLVDLGEDPDAVLATLRRPVPREPGMAARRGTAFHSWVEEHFGMAGMLDLDLVNRGHADEKAEAALGLESLKATFLASDWANRIPAYLEVPVETRIGPVVVRGRIDAVFRNSTGAWDLVDWKTGRRPPAGALKAKSIQLAAYRLAWSRLKGVPLDQVQAAFFYVGDNSVVRPHDLSTAAELEEILQEAFA
ncbi:ATP-dependent DNA helicase [Pseudarthrobacter sp. PS3-L1]|uniref:ATP-dependent helicase n=1 Tax=Pseudarthrobacter sp. PS3-L1 TaxID=3046207 RepID=UPI0024B8DD2F|nr:ATP-dependent DNA helicase [Pseudarthrobacter sp. PS3-L1]MDJ0321449.1 ATP-dependent DNA helicase [Pseudarthrobacter sp. PS3-L1]